MFTVECLCAMLSISQGILVLLQWTQYSTLLTIQYSTLLAIQYSTLLNIQYSTLLTIVSKAQGDLLIDIGSKERALYKGKYGIQQNP